MTDKWFAECLPCKWEERHDSQAGAIDAAVEHVTEKHRDIPPEERARLKMGHIQLRTEGPPPAESEPAPEYFQPPSTPPPDEGPEESEPVAETPPEETEIKSGRHRGRRGEAY